MVDFNQELELECSVVAGDYLKVIYSDCTVGDKITEAIDIIMPDNQTCNVCLNEEDALQLVAFILKRFNKTEDDLQQLEPKVITPTVAPEVDAW